ncbi:hypothetical protein [Pseudomonas simiae]|uniref:hypothetical protein n=1 Tax=Pseudomonas simiae TaxID=321846 RepID=UPI0011B25E02|nr:hypothetical protein [Pseudomonas simiae]
MNSKFKLAFALSLITCSISNAAYVIHIPTEVKNRGSLPDGSISFVKPSDGGNNGGGETPVEPEVPVEPEKPVEDTKTLLYTVSMGAGNNSTNTFSFSNPNLTGSPLSCGDMTTNCFFINAQAGTVVYRYLGLTPHFENTFHHPEAIVVKSGYFNTSSDCSLTSKSIGIWDKAGTSLTLTYSCEAGSLHYPIQPPYTAEKNPLTDVKMTVDFYKVIKG